MRTYGDITNGDYVEIDGVPYQVLETTLIQMQQRRPTMELKVRNLKTGQVLKRTFKSQHPVEEIEIEKEPLKFIYMHRGEFWFSRPDNSKERFLVKQELIGDQSRFLKPNLGVTAVTYNDEVIAVQLPIKIDFKVIEAPPGIKGDTASGGGKPIVIEGGTKINAPLFINEGDIIRVNTQTVEKFSAL